MILTSAVRQTMAQIALVGLLSLTLIATSAGFAGAVESVSSCPNGFEYSEGDTCVDSTPVSPTCPEMYIFNGQNCTSQENPDNSIGATCPEGDSVNELSSMCEAHNQSPACPEGYTREGGSCIPEPVCESGFHLQEETCVEDVVETAPADDGHNTRRRTITPTPPTEEDGGEVLGAESCTPLLTDYMWRGKADNAPEQVTALQGFLNTELGAEIPTTGVFGPLTEASVREFQLKYWEEVLAPWVPFGLETDHTTSGRVYKLTMWKINSIGCAPVVIPAPELP